MVVLCAFYPSNDSTASPEGTLGISASILYYSSNDDSTASPERILGISASILYYPSI